MEAIHRSELRGSINDIEVQQQWYRAQNYSGFGAVRNMPETMCLLWTNSSKAQRFACQWSHEVAMFSEREQISFHHAQPDGLRIQWVWIPPRFQFQR